MVAEMIYCGTETRSEPEQNMSPELMVSPKEVAKLTRLVAKYSPLFTPQQKQAVAKAVSRPTTVHESASGAAKRLRTELRLADNELIRDRQVVELARILVQFVLRLEPVLAGTWGKLNPKSRVRLPRRFDQRVKQFLTTDRASAVPVLNELAGMRVVITAFLAAIAHAGDRVAERLADSVSPDVIRAEIDDGQDGLLKMLGVLIGNSKKERCWDAYCRKGDSLGPGPIKAQIHEAIAADAESFVQNMIKVSRKGKN